MQLGHPADSLNCLQIPKVASLLSLPLSREALFDHYQPSSSSNTDEAPMISPLLHRHTITSLRMSQIITSSLLRFIKHNSSVTPLPDTFKVPDYVPAAVDMASTAAQGCDSLDFILEDKLSDLSSAQSSSTSTQPNPLRVECLLAERQVCLDIQTELQHTLAHLYNLSNNRQQRNFASKEYHRLISLQNQIDKQASQSL